MLELGGPLDRAFGLQNQPRQQDRSHQVVGMLLEQVAQGELGVVELVELELDQCLARRQPGIGRDLGEPFVQWLQGRLILAVLHEPLRTFGV